MTNSILAKLDAPHIFGLALGRAGKGVKGGWTASVCSKDGAWTPLCKGKTAEAAVAAACARIEPEDFNAESKTEVDDSMDFEAPAAAELDFG